MKYLKENIHNLTSMWKIAGLAFQQYEEHENFASSQVPNSGWPQRIWLNKPVTVDILNEIMEMLAKNPAPMAISYWSDFEDTSAAIFKEASYVVKSQQTGMSLELQGKFEHPKRIQLKQVVAAREAEIWNAIYPQNFGYAISAETVLKIREYVQFYLVYLDKNAIGTAVIFETDNTVGIHGLGIIPAFRNQGFAEEAMLMLINRAIDEGKKLATLQASVMGKNIYRNIGFSEDFLMVNYILATNM